MKGKPVDQTIIEIIDYLKAITVKSFRGGMIKESLAGTTLTLLPQPTPKIPREWENPFYPTLSGNETDGLLLSMASGYVILRRKDTSDAVVHIVPTSIPNDTIVAVGNKITLRIQEDNAGKFTSASIVIGAASWPTSSTPTLKGGDDATGAAGDRHIRLCEIIKETDTPEVRIWATGHVDHFAPELVENASASGSRVLKKFDAASGTWQLRRLLAGAGITITENADNIEIDADAAATGLWGTTTWETSSGGSAGTLSHTYENGILTNVGVSGTLAAYSGTGTQLDPYEALITFTDT